MKQIQKGFTLIELMIVVAIIGILAAVAIPAYQDYVIKSKLARVVASTDALKLTLGAYAQDNGSYPVSTAGTTVNYTTTHTTAAAGSVWVSLGMTYEPGLPADLASIVYTADAANPQVITFLYTFAPANVGTGIDGLTFTQTAQFTGTGVNWTCTAKTISNTVAIKFFGC